jgi:phosphinothricin acetyltransferase
MLTVRPALERDASAIALIYNQGIEDRIATFETRLRMREDIEGWFQGRYPLVVVVGDGGQIVGFASTSLYKDRECYQGIAEFSVYVERSWRGRGVGKVAMQHLIIEAQKAGFWKLVSRILVENQASRGLMRTLGFREVGIYYKHARLDGVWRDAVIVERLLLDEEKA